MTFNLGEVLRAKLMLSQFNEDMKQKEELKPAPEAKRKPFQIGNNLNRVLFEQAQLYPTTRPALTTRMVAMGFKKNSVSTIIQQMLRQGLLQADDEGALHLTVAQYTPLKSSKAMRKLALPKTTPGRKKIMLNIRKRTVEEVREERPVSSSPVIKSVWTARDALAGLSILQAQELYAELRNIFGDNK
jgi:hypothetical protein